MGLKERRQREKDEVRLKIMNAARELFATEGIEAVSMRKIAEAMEYSPTIIYQHFADKESLLHEICREDFGALAGVFGEIANVADPLERVNQIGLAYARFGLEYPNHYRLMFMTTHREDSLPEDPKCGTGDPDEDGYAFLKKSVSEAIAAGRYRDGLTDADLISQVLWSAVHGLVSLQITKGNDPWLEWRPFEKRIRLMLESLHRGMERPKNKGEGAMNFLAMKMLMGDRLKYISLVAGLTFAALLVTQQASIFCGYALRTGSWIRDERCCDLWVMNDQADFTEANKPILDTALDRVRGVNGVLWAVPMYRGYLKSRLPDGTQLSVRVIGVDDATLMGAPSQMVQGRVDDLRNDRAVFINVDQAKDILLLKRLAKPRPLQVGDEISVNDHDAVVAGTYRATPEFFWDPVIYTTFSRALTMAPSERRTTSYVLVKVKPGVAISDVAKRIGEIQGLKAITGPEFASITMDYVLKKTGILINFGMTIGLGFVIGALVSGQTLYTFMLDNLKHFAALKAMGAGNFTIARMVGLQSAWAGVLGYGLGIGAASLTGILFSKIGLAFEMPWQIPVLGIVAILVCCTGAAAFSLMRVLRLDPAIVFKG